MSMAVGGKKGGAMSEINVTPMADIMIVLLIIFMVITPMLQKGVDVNLPKAANTSDQKDKKNSVVVAIKLDTTIFLNGKAESVAELPAKLKERIAEQPDAEKIVYIKADINLAYSEVMKVMDLCREAGAEDVALITEKKVQS